MKNYLIFAVLLFSKIPAFSQSIQIPLVDQLSNRSINNLDRRTMEVEDVSPYRGYDTTGYIRYAIKEANFNGFQTLAEWVLKKKLTKKAFVEILQQDEVDSNYIIYKNIPKNNIAIFIGVDSQNSKHIIVDSDGDKDFKNEKEYIFKSNEEKKYPQINVTVDYFNGKIIQSKTIPFFLNIYPRFINDDTFPITLMESSHKGGIVSTEDGSFFIDVDNFDFFLYNNEPFSLSVLSDKLNLSNDLLFNRDSIKSNHFLYRTDSLLHSRHIYSSKDSIQIGKSLYKVDSLANDILYLKYISKAGSHAEINSIAPNIKGNDLLSKLPFELNKKRGTYVMIDFWGSWCGPCIAALPKLVEVQSKYKDKGLLTLSIAMDQLKDIEKLKSIIIDKKLDWTNLFVDRNGSMTILKDYRIQHFPTTLLIDRKGKVVVRSIGAKALEEIDEYLSKKL
ncbi:MAG: TlpA disulfide reductase family protein [Bacteroidota bacterium]